MSRKFGGIFDSVFTPKPPRNKFDLSNDSYGTYKIGPLYPIATLPVIPGDMFRIDQEMLVRAMPMVSPTYGNLKIYTHYFFIPNRLVWKDWEDFITGGEDGDYVGIPKSLPLNELVALVKQVSSMTGNTPDNCIMTKGGLFDHIYSFTIDKTTDVVNDTTPVDLCPMVMYYLVINEYYRDQNVDSDFKPYVKAFMEASTKEDLKSAFRNLLKFAFDFDYSGVYRSDDRYLGLIHRRYIKDYFTSALPFTQRGPDVTLPITGDVIIDQAEGVNGVQFKGTSSMTEDVNVTTGDGGSAFALQANGQNLSYNAGLVGDLSNITSATINDLRRAIALQRFYEISARGGSRYIEQILAHFHVRSSDARLQRPEYIGGGVTELTVGEVLQTSSTDTQSPQGNLAGRGVAYGRQNKVVYRAEEHGYILGFMSIVPPAIYYQGIDSVFTKTDRLDYPWPSFGNLGEQEIKKSEIFVDYEPSGSSNVPVDNSNVLFGYTPRYAEYKYRKDTLHGEMRDSMQYWTWARELSPSSSSSSVSLNSTFLKIPNVSGPFAAPEEDPFVVWISSNISVLRELPYYGTPSSLGL